MVLVVVPRVFFPESSDFSPSTKPQPGDSGQEEPPRGMSAA